MKRELIQNTKVLPYVSGEAVERNGFLSAILGAKIGTAGALTLTITHSDDDVDYVAVPDRLVFPETPCAKDHPGEFTTEALEVGDTVNIDIDLVGLKNYVKITASGAAAASTTLALALGDKNVQPV